MKLAHPNRVAFLALMLVATCAVAQPVYRNVDANGKVTFSDQSSSASRTGTPASTDGGSADRRSGGALPYELRQVSSRYPVTLYTSGTCAPCESGRSLLITRGVPFTERTIETPEDSQALQRLSGQASLPVVTIGTQQLKGFSDAEWSRYLDAAGYPKSTQLPAGYRNSPAAPLVAIAPAPAAATPEAGVAPAPERRPAPSGSSGPNPNNPAGIKF